MKCRAIASADDAATDAATPLCRAPVVGVLELLPPIPRLEMPETETAQCNWPHWLAVLNESVQPRQSLTKSALSRLPTGRTAFEKLRRRESARRKLRSRPAGRPQRHFSIMCCAFFCYIDRTSLPSLTSSASSPSLDECLAVIASLLRTRCLISSGIVPDRPQLTLQEQIFGLEQFIIACQNVHVQIGDCASGWQMRILRRRRSQSGALSVLHYYRFTPATILLSIICLTGICSPYSCRCKVNLSLSCVSCHCV